MQNPEVIWAKLIHSITKKKKIRNSCMAENSIRKWKEKWLTGENICNQNHREGINISNIWTSFEKK